MRLSAEQLAALIDRHAAPLALWAGRRIAHADDVVQEAFCRLAVIDPPPQRPAAWLYRVVRNLAENERLADRRRQRREERAAAAEGYTFDAAAPVLAGEAVQAVERLDDALREVLVGRIWGELTLEEIGQLCGISAATASRRYAAALEQLRKQWSEPCPTTSTRRPT